MGEGGLLGGALMGPTWNKERRLAAPLLKLK